MSAATHRHSLSGYKGPIITDNKSGREYMWPDTSSATAGHKRKGDDDLHPPLNNRKHPHTSLSPIGDDFNPIRHTANSQEPINVYPSDSNHIANTANPQSRLVPLSRPLPLPPVPNYTPELLPSFERLTPLSDTQGTDLPSYAHAFSQNWAIPPGQPNFYPLQQDWGPREPQPPSSSTPYWHGYL